MYLAESILYDFFESSAEDYRLQELKTFITESIDDDKTKRRLSLRVGMKEIHNALLKAALEDLPEDWQAYCVMRYKWRMSLDKQSVTLGYSISHLGKWNDYIKVKVIDILRYRLTTEDVFFRNKIVSVLSIMDSLFALQEKLDPKFEILDQSSLKTIKTYRCRYQELLERLDACTENKCKRYNRGIAIAVENPNVANKERASLCGSTPISYCRYLRTFTNEVRHLVFDGEERELLP